ncbi:DUF5615 family PIN-like protein [Flavobacteriaceae bacterium F89]|uniref:DUF5615 family PIN-like protein n=1 Tax=Cerina litoralis TaxID=2874477 RepID=A0AAE3ETR8_9FLAO|nr:DUF5615 family PIN-like protein [Cerina litoralis]MCG2460084.1 DUF5615 family PIN-like protein [Cerina litoralis]
MKLLLDQNLSPKLTAYFTHSFEEIKHVQELNLDKADDNSILEFARSGGFTIVTRDSDLNDLFSFFGFPPKVIWIRRGNCSTSDIRTLNEDNLDRIHLFGNDDENGILIIL